jgi:hypothetical protein
MTFEEKILRAETVLKDLGLERSGDKSFIMLSRVLFVSAPLQRKMEGNGCYHFVCIGVRRQEWVESLYQVYLEVRGSVQVLDMSYWWIHLFYSWMNPHLVWILPLR